MTFKELNLSAPLLRAVQEAGYETPSPIQAAAIPPVLAGRDLMGCAQTGTGKTAAFALPMLDRLTANAPRRKGAVRALILTPTRELALQIGESFEAYGKYLKLRSTVIFGGVGQAPQVEALKKGVDILIACPGRLNDLIGQGFIDLSALEIFVLDEADRMLDMGFIKDVTRILKQIPHRRNLGMFSATISREVMDISWIYQRDPEEITVQATQENKPDILQYRLDVDSDAKVDAIAAIIKKQGLERVICFCNTKGSTERLTKFLQMRGLDAQCIHGDIPQKKREEVMAQFREGKLHVFVATDVASRGIDVDDVDAVFNFDVPEENEYYVHRIGRTGRAKRHGVAYTLLSDFPSRMRLDDIARNTRSQIVSAKLEEDGTVVPLEK